MSRNSGIGDRLIGEKFAEGRVGNLLSPDEKMYLAIAFVGQGKKSVIAKLY